MLVDLEVPDKKNPGKTITLKRYAVDSNVEPTAVLFGKWSPFTGPNGHGRIVDFAKKNGFKKVAVADIFYESLKGRKIFIAGNHDNVKDKGKIPWIVGEFKIRYKDKTFTLCHYPPTESFDTHAYIHGHTHSGKLNEFENIFNVSADAIKFSPINLNVIMSMLK